MKIRIVYTLVASLSFYAGTMLSMMNRATQQTTRTSSRAAAQCSARLRPTMPASTLTTRSFSALPARPSIQQRAFRAPATSRSFSTAQAKSFQKAWKTGAQPWEILGISNNASYAEAQKAYRVIIQKVHPDKNPDSLAAATQATQEANDALAWFKQDVSSRKSNSYSGNTRKQTAEEQRKEKESYEYYKQRAGDYGSSYGSYSSYKQRGLSELQILGAALAMSVLGLAANVLITLKDVWDTRNFYKELDKEKEKVAQELLATFENLKEQVSTLYTDFEQQKFPKSLVEQFTQELEELKDQITSKLDATKNREERINILRDCNFSLDWALTKRQQLLKDYNTYNFFKRAVDSYEKTVKEHKKTFEDSPRKSLLPAETYQLPKGENYRSTVALSDELEKIRDKLKSEIAQEKAQQQREKEQAKQEQYNQNKERYGRVKALWMYYWGK